MTPAEEHYIFYYELGLAITQWAHVEMALRDVTVNCVSAIDRRTISIGFYSIENFRSKLQFCDKIITERFEASPHFSDWRNLRERLTRASSKRNRLAHRGIIVFPAAHAGRRYALVQRLTEQFTAKSKKPTRASSTNPPQDALCLRDVVQFRLDFFSLLVDLANFAAKLAGRAPEFPPEFQGPKTPPTLSEMRAQMRHILIEQANLGKSR